MNINNCQFIFSYLIEVKIKYEFAVIHTFYANTYLCIFIYNFYFIVQMVFSPKESGKLIARLAKFVSISHEGIKKTSDMVSMLNFLINIII